MGPKRCFTCLGYGNEDYDQCSCLLSDSTATVENHPTTEGEY